MPEIPEQVGSVEQVESARSTLAQVLAYAEGATDEKGAGLAIKEILFRYETVVESEGWQPVFDILEEERRMTEADGGENDDS